MIARIHARRVLAVLLVVNAALLALYLFSVALVRLFGVLAETNQLVRLLDMDSEVSLPKWWAVLQLTVAAALACHVAWCHSRFGGPDRRSWWVLGAVMAIASLDEAVAIHEIPGPWIRAATGITSGPLSAGWVIVAGGALVVLGILLGPFLIRLPRRTRARLVLAAAVFVGGAVGVEMIAWTAVTTLSTPHLPLILDVTAAVEETLELVGVTIFVFALLEYLRDHVPGHAITFEVVPEHAATSPRHHAESETPEPPAPTLAG